jgi:phosphatidylinositol alpha-1,6-mannosyltransferase
MASRGEGFGYVLLEAMPCVPVVASRIDGAREALRHGTLGVLVDPDDPEDVVRGVKEALRKPPACPRVWGPLV